MAFQRQQGISGVLLKATANLMFHMAKSQTSKMLGQIIFFTIFRIVEAKSKIVCLRSTNNWTEIQLTNNN